MNIKERRRVLIYTNFLSFFLSVFVGTEWLPVSFRGLIACEHEECDSFISFDDTIKSSGIDPITKLEKGLAEIKEEMNKLK